LGFNQQKWGFNWDLTNKNGDSIGISGNMMRIIKRGWQWKIPELAMELCSLGKSSNYCWI
jgi:hypothetical protein